MLIKHGTQGTNYYDDADVEMFRYTAYRKANRVKAEKSYKENKILSFPLHVIIEVSSICNIKCSFCNRENMSRKQQNMDMETFKRVVDECAENYVHSLSLYCLGEPFLNPNLREMIIYAKAKGIPYVDVSTNAMLNMNSVIGTGLDEIIVSLDGFKETHEKLRKGAKYDVVVGNLMSLINRRREVNEVRPIIRLQIIDKEETKPEIDKFIQEWKDKVDVIYLKNLETFAQNLGDRNISYGEIVKRLNNRQPCKQLWFVLTVDSNGDIEYCCHSPNGQAVIGNVHKGGLSSAWKKLKKIRKDHINGNYTQICEGCVDYEW